LSKRPRSIRYVVFYLLFWSESWRVVLGGVLALVLAPRVVPPEMDRVPATLVWVMLATIGYCLTGYPARKIAQFWQRLILGTQKRNRRS
jgi:hypothetical protein